MIGPLLGTQLQASLGMHAFAKYAGAAVVAVAPLMLVNRKVGLQKCVALAHHAERRKHGGARRVQSGVWGQRGWRRRRGAAGADC